MKLSSSAPEKLIILTERRDKKRTIRELIEIIGLPAAILCEQIPELQNPELAFGIWRASDGFGTKLAPNQAKALESFILITIAELNINKDNRSNLTGLKRSYHIDLTTKEIQGFTGFHDAYNDLLAKYVQISPEEPPTTSSPLLEILNIGGQERNAGDIRDKFPIRARLRRFWDNLVGE